MDRAYPVGSTYFNKTDSRNPSIILGIGTWIELGGVVLAGVKTGDTTFDDTGEIGAKTHTLTTAQMPQHNHTVQNALGGASSSVGFRASAYQNSGGGGITTGTFNSGNAGSGNAHNNIQPTLVGYMWERTA